MGTATAHAPTGANSPSEPTVTVVVSIVISLLAYHLTAKLVPFLADDLVSKGLRGRDMLKPGFHRDKDVRADNDDSDDNDLPGKRWIPEATGVIGASVYILLLSLFAPLPYLASLLSSSPNSSQYPYNSASNPTLSLEGDLNFPHHSFATYLASLLSLLIATFLGFCDDVFDIRWRFKLPIPLIASVPLLVTYAAGRGVTDVIIPDLFGLRRLLDITSTNGVLHLGWMYYLYMSMLSTFCTNSINILAGINGVEVSQALIIALSLILNDLLYIPFRPSSLLSFVPPGVIAHVPARFIDAIANSGTWSFGMNNGSQELQDRHLFSFYFMLPLVGVCFGLLKHNWYPARAFIGDTFCYFAGMSFAVTAILSHYSKTLLLFFVPQIFNFVYSGPQLFGFVPCPRHRLPRYDAKSDSLVPSWTLIKPPNLRTTRERIGVSILVIAEQFRLVKLERNQDRQIIASTNLTILNLILLWRGARRTREDQLCRLMIAVQVLGSVGAFFVRYGLGSWIYGGEGGNRR
ncbi:UDP-N-acetylglucosamine--dolichyl-phosphate N-acetylglucosaminephosphotransferase [Sporobolomyces koalae]|uniref:UDP-N-acetylglucosamine--dolichyl-phosphate N-acetylglucosaminephosphotransferase n=1 Tax=Sporobolomyces koalae TaxID=500713 RepID=UPI00316DB885